VEPSRATAHGADDRWLTPAVAGIGTASFLSDAGQEIATSLLPSFLTSTLGAPAAALGLIEGFSDAGAGVARLVGGALADDPARRRALAAGGYATTAVLSSAIAAATAPWQVGALRFGAWVARGIRGPARNALLADAVAPNAYGRAYGFERSMDNLGAIVGPVLALLLVAVTSVRTAIALSVVPGLLAAVAILYALRHTQRAAAPERRPFRIRIRPVLRGPLARLLLGVGAFEFGNLAATLMILRATELLQPTRGTDASTEIAVSLYVAYNVAATLSSFPAGRLADRIGAIRTATVGVSLFLAAYVVMAAATPSVLVLGLGFVLAGVGIGAVETSENAAVAARTSPHLMGSAFGLLAALQSGGNLAASGVAGLLWTLVSPGWAFGWAAGWMTISLVLLVGLARQDGPAHQLLSDDHA
jgi:MFS family permease